MSELKPMRTPDEIVEQAQVEEGYSKNGCVTDTGTAARAVEIAQQEAFLAGWKAGRVAAMNVASAFSMKPGRSLHPDIPWEKMNESAKMAAHSTAQSIAREIRALKPPKDGGGL